MEFPARAHVKGRPKFWSEKPKTPATRAGIFGQREGLTEQKGQNLGVYWNGADRFNPLETLGGQTAHHTMDLRFFILGLFLAPGLFHQESQHHQTHFVGAVGFIAIVEQNFARVAVADTDLGTLVRTLESRTDCFTHIIGFIGEAVVLSGNNNRIVEVSHSFHFLSFFVP